MFERFRVMLIWSCPMCVFAKLQASSLDRGEFLLRSKSTKSQIAASSSCDRNRRRTDAFLLVVDLFLFEPRSRRVPPAIAIGGCCVFNILASLAVE